ncbi:MAG: hypothetical protein F6K42_16390 [Leptolyngbya sp. SIO1D8]|nr:hypothetical protein [Leptolyngbya sp. SIO1D8]
MAKLKNDASIFRAMSANTAQPSFSAKLEETTNTPPAAMVMRVEAERHWTAGLFETT